MTFHLKTMTLMVLAADDISQLVLLIRFDISCESSADSISSENNGIDDDLQQTTFSKIAAAYETK